MLILKNEIIFHSPFILWQVDTELRYFIEGIAGHFSEFNLKKSLRLKGKTF